jgi:outer membrane protein assembly factor BamB
MVCRIRLLAVVVAWTLIGSYSRGQDPSAKALLDTIGVSKGICVLIGEAGRHAGALAKESELTLFVQVADDREAQPLRVALDAAGLLGRRVYVQQGDFKRLHLADDLADALIAPAGSAVAEAEALRVVRPEARVLLGDKTVVKTFRPGTDEWSHPYHGPDNNPQSNDTVLRRPYLTHFMAEPWYCPLPMMSVVSGGRIFKVFGNRSSAKPQEALVNKLMAMSAFNGTVLWQRDLSPGFMIHRNTLIATPETLYLADDKSCQLIDTATGKVRDEIVVPADKSDGPVWKWMALENGVLYALVGEKERPEDPLRSDRLRGAGWPWWKIKDYQFGFGKNFLAFDAKTKALLWHHRETEPIDSRGMAMRNGKLYYTCEGKFVACLDAKAGKVLWRNSDRDLLQAVGDTKDAQHWLLGFASTAYLKVDDDTLFFAGPNRPYLAAASAKDGKFLWKRDCSVKVDGNTPTEGGNVLLVVRSDGLYALGQGRVNEATSSFKLNPRTGDVLATFPSRDRCTRATGCIDSIFTRGGKGGSTAVFDVTSQEPKMGTLAPMRPACQDGVVTAHGYLFWGPWSCRCDLTQLGVLSLGPAGAFDYTQPVPASGEGRLQVLSTREAEKLADKDNFWPAYRKDNTRSVRTDLATPEKMALAWTHQPKAPTVPTAPIAGGGLIFTAGQDGVIRALDAATGAVRWTAYTGGPLKYPPTFANHRLYAGAGDGYLYCLEAATGQTLWRFRAAPQERMMPVYGTLTSTWPVNSTAVVDGGNVYIAAGISNFDGAHVYGLDATTGKIRWQNHSAAYEDDLPGNGVGVQGPFLLHKDRLILPSGNAPALTAYLTKDGTATPNAGGGRGKDLYLRGGQVMATGFPLYWRTEDDHYISTMDLEHPAGVLRLGIPASDPTAPNTFAFFGHAEGGERPKELWSNPKIFQEIAGVAFTKDAVLLTGVDRSRTTGAVTSALAAVRLSDGRVLWTEPLPAIPTGWGLALDGNGQAIVTLMDGRVLAFRAK